MFRSFLRELTRKYTPSSASSSSSTDKKPDKPKVEALEDRWMPSTISGFVYEDANGDGIKNAGEQGIAGVDVQLYDSNNTVVDTQTTDQNGFYEFTRDPRIAVTPQTLERSATFAETRTNSTESKGVEQFDPSLGTLTSVEIFYEGSLKSHIQVESLDNQAAAVTGTVSGTLTVDVGGQTPLVTSVSQSEQENLAIHDGTRDFAGPSGHDFGEQTATGTNGATYTAGVEDLSAFIGTGTIDVTHTATATSSASGAGNLFSLIQSSSQGEVRVVYHYLPEECLPDGQYVIREVTTPPPYEDGQETRGNNTPLPGTIGTDEIPITLQGTPSENNNFGEVQLSSLSGYVYEDDNNNAFKNSIEAPIPGVTIHLNGVNDKGETIALTETTRDDGYYGFKNLRPGTYTLSEVQPAVYVDGKDTIGTQGGTTGNDVLSDIHLLSGQQGKSNNFGERLHSSISGHVYQDFNNNGHFNSIEHGLGGVTIALSGTDDLGNSVSRTTTTQFDTGYYEFTNLRPGTYTVTETQPTEYLDGKDTIGTEGGTTGNDVLSAINLPAATNARLYNFGELIPSSIGGFVYFDPNNNGARESGEYGFGNILIRLTGRDDLGNSVNQNLRTLADGSYHFDNLRPGTYELTQLSDPGGHFDGKDTVGTQGGVGAENYLSRLRLGTDTHGEENNFGWIPPASVSGFVYHDINVSGTRDGADNPIGGVLVTLTGTNDLGESIFSQARTGADGSYYFGFLRPGTYSIQETQPVGFQQGATNIGSLGGVAETDLLWVNLNGGQNGVDYNFGEVLPALPAPSPFVATPPTSPLQDPFSKRLFLGSALNR